MHAKQADDYGMLPYQDACVDAIVGCEAGSDERNDLRVQLGLPLCYLKAQSEQKGRPACQLRTTLDRH